jgi:hypothetical protein
MHSQHSRRFLLLILYSNYIAIICTWLMFARKIQLQLSRNIILASRNLPKRYSPRFSIKFKQRYIYKKKLIIYSKKNISRPRRKIYRIWINFRIMLRNKEKLLFRNRSEWWINRSVADKIISKYSQPLSITVWIEDLTWERGNKKIWRWVYCCKLIIKIRLQRLILGNKTC